MSWLWTWLFEYASSSDDSQTEAEILYEVDHEDKKKNGSTSSAAKSCDPSGETLLKHAEQASTSSKGPRSSICVSNQKKPKAEPVSAKAKAALESKATLHAKKVEEDFLVAKLSKPTKKKSANTEKKSTTGKRKPHQKATARKQKSEQLKNNGNTKADEDVSGMKASWSPSKNLYHDKKGVVDSDTKERTLAFVPSEENQDTKRGWRKEKPLAAVKVIHKASSFSGDCTNVKQDITKKKRHPLKTHQSGNIQVVSLQWRGATLRVYLSEVNPHCHEAPPEGASTTDQQHFLTMLKKCCRAPLKSDMRVVQCKAGQRPVKNHFFSTPEARRTCYNEQKPLPPGKKRNKENEKTTKTNSSSKNEESQPTQFKAKPAPDSSRAFRLRNVSAPVTEPKPFKLASLERHQEWSLDFKKKKEQIEKARLQTKKFVARPMPKYVKEQPHSVVPTTKKGSSEHVNKPRSQ